MTQTQSDGGVLCERTGNLLSPEQAALDRAAMAFYDKMPYVQYDQYRMLACTSGDPMIVYDTRRECFASPEIVSYERWTHLDCSSFVWAIYDSAFGNARDLFVPKTGWMEDFVREAKANGKVSDKDKVVYLALLETKEEHTKENYARVIREIREKLQPGDLIVFRRWNEAKKSKGGHVVMYLDGDYTIEVRGGSYEYVSGKDSTEPDGAILFYPLDELLFNPAAGKRYLFGRPNTYCVAVLRPLNAGGCTVTEEAAARMALGRLSVSKTALPVAQTVEPDGELTYTITLDNAPRVGCSKELALTVRDPLPEGADFVSADGGALTDGAVVFDGITLRDGETKKLRYTVKPKAGAKKLVSGVGDVNGVSFTYRDIPVGRHLTLAEEAALAELLAAGKGEGVPALAWLNDCYRKATGRALGTDDADELIDSFFAPMSDSKGEARWRIAPQREKSAIYDAWIEQAVIGRHVMHTSDEEYMVRVRYLKPESLRFGDILAVRGIEGGVFFYVYRSGGLDLLLVNDEGTKEIKTATALEGILSHAQVLLFRPSMLP